MQYSLLSELDDLSFYMRNKNNIILGKEIIFKGSSIHLIATKGFLQYLLH